MKTNNNIIVSYFGITHEEKTDKQYAVWCKNKCPKGEHLFDEVLTSEQEKNGKIDFKHYLYCDACGLIVNIKSIDLTHVK